MGVVKGPDNSHDQRLIQLVEQYQTALLRMCYVDLQDEELARDAVQETFLKAYKALPSFRDECSEKTWLFSIAVNTCRSMRRSAWFRHVDRRVTPDQLPGAIPAQDDDSPEILCEIMKLPPKLREVVMLYYWKDMSMNEIAAALHLAQSTVTARLKRAREKLRVMLERRGYRG